MQPDLLHDVFGVRDAARPPGEEPDELQAMRRKDRRQTGGPKRVRVGYCMAPNVIMRVLPVDRSEVAPEMSAPVRLGATR
ncbi:hypothetical protein ASE88_12205 [Sphingomonas sp. Leaf38]|nr:hypothetical protein ASE88_12205 [Sphingomonas sp. Leaf38]